MPDHARMPMTALMRGGGRLSAPRSASRGGSGKAEEPGTDQPAATPFVKWAGGKRRQAPKIKRLLGSIDFNNYWEPFVGGGALFFHICESIDGKIHISDINEKLITAYKVIRDSHKEIIPILEYHREEHRKHGIKHYEKVKKNFWKEETDAKNAASFIYLNKTCFNGLFRVNKSGEFNVSMGSYKNPSIFNEDNIKSVSRVLKKKVSTIKSINFDKISPQSGDVVYCDPPYDDTFTGYTKDGFGKGDQEFLRDKCNEWRKNGAHVIVSNSNTDKIRKLYRGNGFKHHVVHAARHINSDASGRGKIKERIIVGGPIK